jgi:putative transcriptional regulator
MKDQSILKAATEIPASERDSRPMTAEERKNARRRPRVTVIREFGIPLGTLRDWEQERAEPDAPARAYLRAIAGNAEAVAKALKSYPAPAAE